MQFQFQQAFRSMVLFAFFLFLTKLHIEGDITKYINPRYERLSQIAAALFLLLFFIQLHRIWGDRHTHNEHCHHGCGHDHGQSSSFIKKGISYSILIFPLVTGFFLPAKTLDASIAAKKGVVLTAQKETKSEEGAAAETESSPPSQGEGEAGLQDEAAVLMPNEMSEDEYQKNMKQLDRSLVIDMKDEVFEPYYGEIGADPQKYAGRTVRVRGFVYKEKSFQPDQLVLSRFLITHCIADASLIGFLTEFDKASAIKQDTWLEVEGTLQVQKHEGSEVPMLKVRSWKGVPEPNKPYVYPVFTKLE